MTRIVVVTGLSGAGRTSALRALEDIGFEAVDNLPIGLLPRLLHTDRGLDRPLAVGVDPRTRAFDPALLLATVERLRRRQLPVRLLYLEADDDTLLRRFSETRRRHPLAADRPVADGIARERQILAPLRAAADLVVDTTGLALTALRALLAGHFGDRPGDELLVHIVSFGYRAGLPREADLVFDVRFLANPHYVPALRPRTGRDPEVVAHVCADPFYPHFEQMLDAFVSELVPRFRAEGRSYLTVAIGCTGGRHRSVVVAERLSALLAARGLRTEVRHRDLEPADPAREPVPMTP
ncbi:Nucleotide-binding protein [bacterium HR40]|nr:Nucleotide-binding protein [bacterium HR40]